MTNGKPLLLTKNDMVGIKTTIRLAYLVIKNDVFAALKPKAGSLNIERHKISN